jgi:glycosyltransferase involved in cell wall biosynthesis
MPPLISCLCPTADRRWCMARCIQSFQAYTYENLEMIVLDDGDDPIKDMIPDDPRVRYFYELPKKNHGQKMNRCCELALGEYMIVHDSDDLYPSYRVSIQTQPLIDNPEMLVSGTSVQYCYLDKKAYRYQSNGWLAAIAFPKSEWVKQGGFKELPAGADWRFQQVIKPNQRVDLVDPTLVLSCIHTTNAGRRSLNRLYTPVPWDTIGWYW